MLDDTTKRLRDLALQSAKEELTLELENLGGIEAFIDVDRFEWKARIDNSVAYLTQATTPEHLQKIFVEIILQAQLGYMLAQMELESETGEQAEPAEEEGEEDFDEVYKKKYSVTPVMSAEDPGGQDLPAEIIEGRNAALEYARAINMGGVTVKMDEFGTEFVHSPFDILGCRISPVTEE